MTSPQRQSVIRDVIDSFTPSVEMTVLCNANDPLFNGHMYFASTLASKPKVEVPGGDMNSFFTLVMTDPDVPSPSDPHLREHVHWIVIDIPGTTDTSRGREVLSYDSPTPNVGIHRFVFVLFKQKRIFDMNVYDQPRDGFSTRGFAQVNDLGAPVAAFYLNAKKDKKTT